MLCQVTPLRTRHAGLQPQARARHCLGTLGVCRLTERPPGMWHNAQSSELPAVEINWKLFLLTRPLVSDSDALGWVVAPTVPAGHIYSVMVCPPNMYWKPSSKILGWCRCRPAPSRFVAGVPKTLLWSRTATPCLTSVYTHVVSPGTLTYLYLVSGGFKTWLRGHHLQEVFLDRAPCQDPPRLPFITLIN